jgi:hypothetical protein
VKLQLPPATPELVGTAECAAVTFALGIMGATASANASATAEARKALLRLDNGISGSSPHRMKSGV